MQNTLKNKAKFFAQYWGQKVLVSLVKPHMCIFDVPHDNEYILLTLLSSITDEDAIEVAKIMYPKDKHNEKDSLNWGKDIVREIIEGQTDKDVIWFAGIIPVVDYLRSRGYALPWTSVSVEQQVEWGWVKPIQNPIQEI